VEGIDRDVIMAFVRSNWGKPRRIFRIARVISRDFSLVPPKYKSKALPLYQPHQHLNYANCLKKLVSWWLYNNTGT